MNERFGELMTKNGEAATEVEPKRAGLAADEAEFAGSNRAAREVSAPPLRD